jgi:hypothetical protein
MRKTAEQIALEVLYKIAGPQMLQGIQNKVKNFTGGPGAPMPGATPPPPKPNPMLQGIQQKIKNFDGGPGAPIPGAR